MPLRIGVLGAARVTPRALLKPAEHNARVNITAIAARDPGRAARYARRHHITLAMDSYATVVSAPDIDAIYIALPAALHGAWTLKAIAAGKHVLVEKPLAANADEAQLVRDAAKTSGLVVMQAHHTTFHPFTAQIRELIRSGRLGNIQAVSSWFHVPIPPATDIRWKSELGGGALMDVGCYPIRLIQDVLGTPHVVDAAARRRGAIDRRMTAHLKVDDIPVTIDCGLWSAAGLGYGLMVTGSAARLRVRAPFHPQRLGTLRLDGPGLRSRVRADRRSSYSYQLEAFCDAIEVNEGSHLDADVTTIQIIDDIYRAAGMSPRQPLT